MSSQALPYRGPLYKADFIGAGAVTAEGCQPGSTAVSLAGAAAVLRDGFATCPAVCGSATGCGDGASCATPVAGAVAAHIMAAIMQRYLQPAW